MVVMTANPFSLKFKCRMGGDTPRSMALLLEFQNSSLSPIKILWIANITQLQIHPAMGANGKKMYSGVPV